MFCGWSERKTTTSFFFSWTLTESFRIQLQRKLPTFDELTRQNKRDKVWRSALAYILVWDCASSISLLTASLSCCSSSTCSWHFFSSSLKEKNWQVKDRRGFDDSTSYSFRFIHYFSEIVPNLWYVTCDVLIERCPQQLCGVEVNGTFTQILEMRSLL